MGPEEIERIITDRVENAVAVVPNVEEIRSQSEEGRSRVTLEFAQGTNIDEAANDVRAALDRIRDDLPPEVESPRLWKFDPDNFPVIILGAKSDRGMETLTRILEREVSQRFEQIPGAGSVDTWGGVYREIQVRLLRDRLASSLLTADDVQRALQRENVTLPGGDMREGMRDMYVRTRGEYQSVDDIANTIITTVDGQPIRVRDVAEVVDGYQDVNRLVQIDGQPMVRLGIRKQSGANTVAVAERARRVMEQINRERDDLELLIVVDQSEFITSSIRNVQTAAIWGGLLAVFILYVFLRNGSTTFIIALSIPISLIATFGLLFFNGLTLNQMSFGGIALGIGLIVDNAIVVLDNIVRLREGGREVRESALLGTRQVGGAIIASTLTTTVIFLPVVFMQTISGILFRELALVVVFALLCSLLVALTLVPMLASRYLSVRRDAEGGARFSFLARIGRGLKQLEDGYARRLAGVIHHRIAVLGIAVALLAGAIALWPLLPVELAPQTDADEIDVELEMAQGTNIAVVNEYLYELERIVRDAAPMDQVEHMTIEIRPGDAEVELALLGADKRTMDSFVIADEIRRRVAGKIPGADVRGPRAIGAVDVAASLRLRRRWRASARASRLRSRLRRRAGSGAEAHDGAGARDRGRPREPAGRPSRAEPRVRSGEDGRPRLVGGRRGASDSDQRGGRPRRRVSGGGRGVPDHRAAPARRPPDHPRPVEYLRPKRAGRRAAGVVHRAHRAAAKPHRHRARRLATRHLHHRKPGERRGHGRRDRGASGGARRVHAARRVLASLRGRVRGAAAGPA